MGISDRDLTGALTLFGGEPMRRCPRCRGRLLRDLEGRWFCPRRCEEAR